MDIAKRNIVRAVFHSCLFWRFSSNKWSVVLSAVETVMKRKIVIQLVDPKPIVDAIAMHAASGGIILLASYGGKLLSGTSPLRDLVIFSGYIGITMMFAFGFMLWAWVSVYNAAHLYSYIIVAEWSNLSVSGRQIAAIAIVLAYAVFCTFGGGLLFILTGVQSGIIS